MNSSEEFNCLFCQDTFDSKEELQIHFRKHGDPKFNQSAKSKPATEMATTGDRTEEMEVVNCDVCDEVFPTISKAITHKHKMHPDHDAKYFCPWCGKLFTMKHLYNKHIQNAHKSEERNGETGFHCDNCEVDFYVPSAMVYHNKFFHRQDTELAAIGHSKKLKMFNQEPLQIYYCPFCGEEYYNKVNLHKHMGDDHIDENQSPEDVLRCPLCEAVFYHLDAYEVHLTFHSSDDQYSEENELLKEITEFSLETVPPMMEKVENESQEDEPAGSVGIEELLQQGMNESNDYDSSDEPRRKKKRKKHKKSKKTITLDEFLNMHSDVLGEGLDVQGIVEVPSQVVTKQLRKPPLQKLKQTIKIPSPELAKLKKAGIVITKKPIPFQGMKVTRKPTVNTAQTSSKITPIKTKQDSKISSKDILSKLLNQSNSQIKIVKKSAAGNTDSDILPSSKISSEDSKKLLFDDSEVRKANSDSISANDPNHENIHEVIDNANKELESNIHPTHDISSKNSNNICADKLNTNDTQQLTKESKLSNETHLEEDIEEPSNHEKNDKQSNHLHNSHVKTTLHGVNVINALRNRSQHITIKSLSSPNTIQNEQKQPVDGTQNTDIEDSETKNPLYDSPLKITDKNPLTALKHLSHLTVKSANQSKIVSSSNKQKEIVEQMENSDIDEESDKNLAKNELYSENSSVTDNTDTKAAAMKLDALKNLSKQITVKSTPHSPKTSKNTTDNIQLSESIDEKELVLTDSNLNKNTVTIENKQKTCFPNRPAALKNTNHSKSPEARLSTPNNSPKILKTQPNSEVQNQNRELELYDPKVQSNVSIIKQSPNVTSKPVNVATNVIHKVKVQSFTQSTNVQKGNISKTSVNKIENKQNQEIEIYNIDDSDDELDSAKSQQNSKSTSASKTIEATNIEKNMEVLKNLSKNITVKPKKQENSPDHDEMSEDELHTEDFRDEDGMLPEDVLENQVNVLLQNKLKSLGSITMKSNNSSPKSVGSTHASPKVKISQHIEEYESDPETHSEVKITELPEDYPSDDDIPLINTKNGKNKAEDLPSDNDIPVEDCDDLETCIKPNTLQKPTLNLSKTPTCLNNLKNLTVKSLRENKVNQNDDIPENFDDDNSIINKKLNMQQKTIGQDNSEDENQESSNIPVRQQIRRAVNHNVSATSSNQTSTVNKAVTVQTFQTKTVIEEVTTTVTKTIRTVNQTTSQEAQNVSQKMVTNIRPQKIQGFRPNQQVKNFQGMSVRPATPISPRMRNPVITSRPLVGNNIRPSNQLVPMRANVARLSNPRMPVAKKITPSTSSPHKPVLGKPLKISPNAMVPINKRPAPENTSGPFSCFKKPKESLIPGIPSKFLENEGDTTIQYSTSHTSQSNFASMTKTVKGNTSVTSTQMKSEVNSSSEQLNRLNSMSGLKVVKTSQMKHASKVEEKVEVDPAKQSALNAIERLQRQGLLKKKPLIEEPDDSDHSNPEAGDDYYDS